MEKRVFICLFAIFIGHLILIINIVSYFNHLDNQNNNLQIDKINLQINNLTDQIDQKINQKNQEINRSIQKIKEIKKYRICNNNLRSK